MSDENGPPPDPPKEPPQKETRPEVGPDEEYKVGPGRPPREHTWKKGGPSPNPKGRKKKEPTMAPDLKQALEDALNTKVKAMTKDQRERTLTKGKMGIEQLVNQFAKGDRHARRDLMDYAPRLGVDLLAGARKTIEALTPDHQAILYAYMSRRTGNADVAPTSPVIAPPELLDDDVAQPEPAADQAPPPSAPSNPPTVKLPRTPQDIREERLRRHKRQAEFEAASVAVAERAPASVDPDPVTPDPPPPKIVATEPPPARPATHSPKPEPAAPVTTTSSSTPPEGAAGISPSSPVHESKSGLDAPAPQFAPGLNNPPLPKRPMTAQELRNEKMRLKRLQSEASKAAMAGPAPASVHPDPTALQPPAPAKSVSRSSAQEPAPDLTTKMGGQ